MTDADPPPSGFTQGVRDERARILGILDEAWKSPKLKPLTRMALAVVAARVRDPEYRVPSWTTFDALQVALDPVARFLTEAAHKARDAFIATLGHMGEHDRDERLTAKAAARVVTADILHAQLAALTAGPTPDEGQS